MNDGETPMETENIGQWSDQSSASEAEAASEPALTAAMILTVTTSCTV